jgi:phosphoenolpyruvate carboxylase
LAATIGALTGSDVPRPAVGTAPAYAEATEFLDDLDVLSDSLTTNGSSALARGRLRLLRRAVDVFAFHLAPIDLRQNSDVHERMIGELFAAVRLSPEYRALGEEARASLLLSEIRSPRPLASLHLSYSDETAAELAPRRMPRQARGRR